MATKRNTPKSRKKTKRITLPKATTLENHLAALQALHDASDPSDTGACLVSDPQTGQSRCILTSQPTCKALHGVFMGGPCGG